MKTLLKILTAGITLSFGSISAQAVSLSLLPVSQTIGVGGAASVEVVISDLGDLVAPSLGAFDLDISYDPAVVSASSVSFGNFLDLGTFGSVQSSDLSVAGTIHLDEISLESPGDLNNAQPDPFVLATLGFTGLNPGISALTFALASLSDEGGQSILDFSIETASIEVIGGPVVPDGGATASLLLLGLASVCTLRRFRPVAE